MACHVCEKKHPEGFHIDVKFVDPLDKNKYKKCVFCGGNVENFNDVAYQVRWGQQMMTWMYREILSLQGEVTRLENPPIEWGEISHLYNEEG